MKQSLKDYINDNKYTQEEVSCLVGVHKSTIKRLLGTLGGNVGLFTRIAVANFLDDEVSKKEYQIDDLNTKHYSDRRNILLFNLLDNFDEGIEVIEPFAGNGSLIPVLRRFKSMECYDIVPQSDGIIERDTLNFPPNYKGKYVITNPPYLARNKSDDKTIFEKYDVDDLYKAFIKSIVDGDCDGGAMIIPLNFFTDENSKNIRELFLSKYRIDNLNIFKCQMFDYTKYNTCSFNFFKDDNGTKKVDTLIFNTRNNVLNIEIILDPNSGYRLFGEFYDSIPKRDIKIERFTNVNQNPSHILIKCIDGISDDSKIRAEYVYNREIGKESDRNTAILVLEVELTEQQEQMIINKFNTYISTNREKYYNLIFTNFRENNRKRIGFDLAYDIIAMCVKEVVGNE